jgi:DNA-binding response OmpR family regulator
MRIAILDNDAAQAEQMRLWLSRPSTTLQRFHNLDAMTQGMRKGEIDLMVVHWTPATDAKPLKEAIDQRSPVVPLLLVTERSALDAQTELLNYPAVDYLLKPLRRMDLITRVDVLGKRFYTGSTLPEDRHVFGPYVFDTRMEQLSLNDEPIRLTEKEFRLALLFFRHMGKPLSRAFILESVWPENAEFSSRSMDTHVSRVRTKLGLQPARGFRLAPVYSYGYRLEQINVMGGAQ